MNPLENYISVLSLQIYDLKLELEDIKKSLNPVAPKTLPTLNFNKLKELAIEEAFKQTKNTSEVANLTGVSERTIARIISGK